MYRALRVRVRVGEQTAQWVTHRAIIDGAKKPVI
jgi:hypothetical protein